MANYRDPKVTTTHDRKKGGMGKWLAIAAAIIIALLLLWWLLGSGEEASVEPVPVEPVVEEPIQGEGAVVVPVEPVAPAD